MTDKILYLSGGSAFGAWQAGLLARILSKNVSPYSKVVAASAGALNATCIILAIYEYAAARDARDADVKGAHLAAARKLKEMWYQRIYIPGFIELVIRMVLCGVCRVGSMFEHEIQREVRKFESMFSEGTIIGCMKNMGCKVNGVLIPQLSIVTKIHQDTSASHAMFTFIAGKKLSLRKYVMNIDNIEWGPEAIFDVDKTILLSVIRASCAIPLVFPPVYLILNRSQNKTMLKLTDGADGMYIPVPLPGEMKNFAENSDFIICAEMASMTSDVADFHSGSEGSNMFRVVIDRQISDFKSHMRRLMTKLSQRLMKDNISESADNMRICSRDFLTKTRGRIFFIPTPHPLSPNDSQMPWDDKDYSAANKKRLFDAGQNLTAVSPQEYAQRIAL
jgi:predicted acylesterase/phospholipase RssA